MRHRLKATQPRKKGTKTIGMNSQKKREEKNIKTKWMRNPDEYEAVFSLMAKEVRKSSQGIGEEERKKKKTWSCECFVYAKDRNVGGGSFPSVLRLWGMQMDDKPFLVWCTAEGDRWVVYHG